MSDRIPVGAEVAVVRARALTKVFKVYRSFGERLMATLLGRERPHREIVAVRDLDLMVRPGDCVGVMGPNGAGKSTLLKLLNGALFPTSGDLEVKGRVAILDLGAGLNPQLSGRDNLVVTALSRGLRRQEVVERIQEWIDFSELGEAIDDPLHTYSTGMAMRLAFSLNAHLDAEVMIIDEAFAVGDARFVLKCRRKIDELRNAGTTIFLASHDANAVAELCDWAILLDRGRVVHRGDPVSVGDAYHTLLGAHTSTSIGSRSVRVESAPTTLAGFLDGANVRRDTPLPESDATILALSVEVGGKVSSGLVAHGDECTLRWLIRAKRPFRNLTSGVHLHTQFGTYVFGTSYVHLGKAIEISEPGVYQLSIRIRMNLGPGKYVLSLGIAEPDIDTHALGGRQLDRFRSAYEFEVRNFDPRPGQPVPFFGATRLDAAAEPPLRVEG